MRSALVVRRGVPTCAAFGAWHGVHTAWWGLQLACAPSAACGQAQKTAQGRAVEPLCCREDSYHARVFPFV